MIDEWPQIFTIWPNLGLDRITHDPTAEVRGMDLQRKTQKEINSDIRLSFRGHQKFVNLLLAESCSRRNHAPATLITQASSRLAESGWRDTLCRVRNYGMRGSSFLHLQAVDLLWQNA